LDRSIKPKVDSQGNHYPPHHFSPIEEATPGARKSSREAACEHFRKGLLQQQNRCPDFSEMKTSLSGETPKGQDPEKDKPGSVEATEAIACVWEQLNKAAEALEKERKIIYAEAEKEIVNLALAISEKILSHEAHVNPEMILSVVRKALQKSKDTASIRIRIHPLDLEILQQAELKPACPQAEFNGIGFLADELLVRGDCLVETAQGYIQAGIRDQLAFIDSAFAALGDTMQNEDIELNA